MALRLDWEEERYARIYCRDTLDWQCLSWNAQSLWMQLNRKATRSGRIDLGRSGLRGVAALVGRPDMRSELEQAMAELLADGCVVLEGDVLVIPDFVEAQEAVSSGAKRMRELRERRREEEAAGESEGLPARDSTKASEKASRKAGGTGPGTVGGNGSAGTPAGAVPGASDESSHRETERNRGDESSRNVTRGYSTERKARHGAPGGGVEGAALTAAFAADLDAEATEDDVRRGRVLAAMGAQWRIAYDIAAAVQGRRKRPDVEGVNRDLLELQRRGLVERSEMGAPPVTHWHATAAVAGAEDAA
jgi:hypothetical protein